MSLLSFFCLLPEMTKKPHHCLDQLKTTEHLTVQQMARRDRKAGQKDQHPPSPQLEENVTHVNEFETCEIYMIQGKDTDFYFFFLLCFSDPGTRVFGLILTNCCEAALQRRRRTGWRGLNTGGAFTDSSHSDTEEGVGVLYTDKRTGVLFWRCVLIQWYGNQLGFKWLIHLLVVLRN